MIKFHFLCISISMRNWQSKFAQLNYIDIPKSDKFLFIFLRIVL